MCVSETPRAKLAKAQLLVGTPKSDRLRGRDQTKIVEPFFLDYYISFFNGGRLRPSHSTPPPEHMVSLSRMAMFRVYVQVLGITNYIFIWSITDFELDLDRQQISNLLFRSSRVRGKDCTDVFVSGYY